MTPKKIPISEFKAKCLELIDNVSTSGKEIIITKRDKEIAKVIPFNPAQKKSIFGSLKNQIEITGDIK